MGSKWNAATRIVATSSKCTLSNDSITRRDYLPEPVAGGGPKAGDGTKPEGVATRFFSSSEGPGGSSTPGTRTEYVSAVRRVQLSNSMLNCFMLSRSLVQSARSRHLPSSYRASEAFSSDRVV